MIKYSNLVLDSLAWKIFINILILVSCIRYTIDTPLVNPDSQFILGWRYYGDFCNLIFGVEFIFNLLRYGFIVGKTSYLRRHWYNVISFVVVMSAAFSYIPRRHEQLYMFLDKVKILKIFSFVEIQETRDKNMRIALRSSSIVLRKVLKLFGMMMIFFGFFAIILTKVFKESSAKCWNL